MEGGLLEGETNMHQVLTNGSEIGSLKCNVRKLPGTAGSLPDSVTTIQCFFKHKLTQMCARFYPKNASYPA